MRRPQHPHPDKINGEFQSEGGRHIYSLLWGLTGRVGRLEGGFLILTLLLGAILAKLEGAY
jgi:hypothetical protein